MTDPTEAKAPDRDPSSELGDPAGVDRWFVVAAVSVCVVLRFVTTSPMWLDEALSVNIASLPVGDIFEALRHDGHPPLYYVLLHYWMELLGDGDVAIRALSGVFSVATLPLAWVAGRRRWGTSGAYGALLLTAIAPFSLRYATEARMYAMVSFLALAAWLLADDLRSRSDARRWVLLALATGALLLTHYWAIYLGIACVLVLALRWWRVGARDEALRIGSALAVGAVLFLPWLPAFLYQAGHTGTPWATPARPTQAVLEVVTGLGNGPQAEGMLFGIAVLGLVTLGLLVVEQRPWTLVLDLRTSPVVRAEVAIIALTLGVGLAAGAASGGAFLARYAAVLMPLVFIAAGIGLAAVPRVWPLRVVALVVTALAMAGAYVNVTDERTQGEEVATAINAGGAPGDVVLFCPDQLGPSTLRALDDGFMTLGVPTLESPERVDWVDYAERNEAADPADVTAEVLERAGPDATIWYVYADGYRTYEGLCSGVLQGLGAARPASETVVESKSVGEPAFLLRFDP